MERGATALSGQEETVPSHRFPPDDAKTRTIYFKGEFLRIYNQKTKDSKTSAEEITEYTPYEIPPGYTCYVIGASVYFRT